MRRVTLLVLFAISTGLVPTARAETVTIPASRDNTLFKTDDGSLSSGAGPGIFCGNNSLLNTRRALVYFDVAGAIAGAAVIDSVELRLNVDSAPNSIPQQVSIHRALASWGEGTSVSTGGAGAASMPDDATWLHRFYPDSLWATPGGDFDPAVHAVATVGETGVHVWKSSALAQDVSDWLVVPGQNFGWLIQGPEDAASTARRFDSRETANGPQLVVHYTPTTPATKATSLGRLKSLYR